MHWYALIYLPIHVQGLGLQSSVISDYCPYRIPYILHWLCFLCMYDCVTAWLYHISKLHPKILHYHPVPHTHPIVHVTNTAPLYSVMECIPWYTLAF